MAILVHAAHHQRQASAPPRLVSHRQSPTDRFRGGLVTSAVAWWWSATTCGTERSKLQSTLAAEPVMAAIKPPMGSMGSSPALRSAFRHAAASSSREAAPLPSHAPRRAARTPRTKGGCVRRDGQPYGVVPAAWFDVGTLFPDSEAVGAVTSLEPPAQSPLTMQAGRRKSVCVPGLALIDVDLSRRERLRHPRWLAAALLVHVFSCSGPPSPSRVCGGPTSPICARR